MELLMLGFGLQQPQAIAAFRERTSGVKTDSVNLPVKKISAF